MTHVSRRTLLRAGTVAGAAAWTVPAVNLIGLGHAHAQVASAPPSGRNRIPSFGGFLVLVGSKYYGYQVTEAGLLDAVGEGNGCAKLLKERNGVTVQATKGPTNPPGVTVGRTKLSNGDDVLFVSGVDTTLLAFTHDGSFQFRPDNEFHQPHYRSGVGPAAPVTGTAPASGTTTTSVQDEAYKKFLLATSYGANGWIFLKD